MNIRSVKRLKRLQLALARTQGSARLVLLVLLAFALGASLTAVWFHRAAPASRAPRAGTGAPGPLSESTRAVLAQLNAPLTVRFYSLLDPGSVPASTRAFAQRASQLLGEYEQQAGGKLKLSRIETLSTANENAAAADGLQAFDVGIGQACYLGLALSLQGQKETIPHLSPEWEPALESDLTRAIAKLLEALRPAQMAGATSQANTAAEQAVKTLIPDLANVSVEQGTRLIRANALKAFQAAAAEMEARVKEAQQQLAEAQTNKSSAEQQAAMQQLQQLQAEQAAKLKEISAQAQAEIEALHRLKANP